MVVKTLNEPVFNIRLTIIANTPLEKLIEYIEGKYSRKSWEYDEDPWSKFRGGEGGCFSLTHKKRGVVKYFMWIERAEDVFTLDHETVHIAEEMLESRGVESSGETLAYYKSYWFKRCCVCLSRGSKG